MRLFALEFTSCSSLLGSLPTQAGLLVGPLNAAPLGVPVCPTSGSALHVSLALTNSGVEGTPSQALALAPTTLNSVPVDATHSKAEKERNSGEPSSLGVCGRTRPLPPGPVPPAPVSAFRPRHLLRVGWEPLCLPQPSPRCAQPDGAGAAM